MRRAIYTTDYPALMLVLGCKNTSVEVEVISYDGDFAEVLMPVDPESPLAILSGREGDTNLPSTRRRVPRSQLKEIDAEA